MDPFIKIQTVSPNMFTKIFEKMQTIDSYSFEDMNHVD